MGAPEAFFRPAGGGQAGQRFCLLHEPADGAVRGAVVYVHPFTEEMNKSRRMAGLQARAMADAGYAVLQVDLLGCGDSSGDFADATWPHWVDDVADAADWLRRRHAAPLWFWGLRAGCMLAADAAARVDMAANFLFWQPTVAGKPLLQQFLRLKLAGDMLEGKAKGTMDRMKQQLASGAAVDIAGYRLSAELARGLEAARLTPPPAGSGGRVEWLELSSRADPELSPASTLAIERWQAAGFAVRSRVVEGAAFWQTTEITDAPALVGASLAAMQAPILDTVAA